MDLQTTHLTQCITERPRTSGVNDCKERETDDNEEVDDCKTGNERVDRAAHLQVGDDHDDDREVSDEAEHGSDTQNDWNHLRFQYIRRVIVDVEGGVVDGGDVQRPHRPRVIDVHSAANSLDVRVLG